MAQEKNNPTTAQPGQTQSAGQSKQMTTGQPSQQRGLARREDLLPALWADGPFALMRRLSEEMDRLFNDVFADFGTGQGGLASRGGHSPSDPRRCSGLHQLRSSSETTSSWYAQTCPA